MQCFGGEGSASITVRVNYWRVDFIDEVHAVSVADTPGVDLDPTSSVKLFSALAKLAATPAQTAEVASFVATKVTGSDCPDGCRMIINAIAVTVETGSRGAASMTLAQDRP
jgi:hypothetical protein